MHLALERLLAAWQPLRQLHAAELLQQVAHATDDHPPGDATWVGTLKLPALDPARLVAALELALDDGRSTALDEAHRQAPALAEAAQRAQRPDHAKRLQAYADGAERLLAAGMLQSASTEAFRLTATSDEVDIAGHVETILGETPMLAERDILAGMATGAINEGRYEVMDFLLGSRSSGLEAAAGDDVAHIYALEILDKNTCSECAAIDGQEYFAMEQARKDYPGIGGGYIRCLGRTRCRGSLVIVYGDEAPPTQQSETPPERTPPPTPPAPKLPEPEPSPTKNEFGIITPIPGASPAEVERTIAANGELLLDAYRDKLGALELEAYRLHGARTLAPDVVKRGFREVMEEHGIKLTEPGDLSIAAGKRSRNGPPLEGTVHEASTLYPADWTERANQRFGSLVFNDIGAGKRAYYSPLDRAIALDSGTDLEVAVHEIAHHMEAVLGSLSEQEKNWLLARRKPGEKPVRVPGYGRDEKFIRDELPSVYTGRIYASSADETAAFYEVLSTGMQALSGARGFQMQGIRNDTSHMRSVLGILATLRP